MWVLYSKCIFGIGCVVSEGETASHTSNVNRANRIVCEIVVFSGAVIVVARPSEYDMLVYVLHLLDSIFKV